MANRQLLRNRPGVQPTQSNTHVVEGVRIGDASKRGHQAENLASHMLVVHPVHGVLHDTRHRAVVFGR